MKFSEAELDDWVRDLADDLCNSDDQITGLIDDTNASGWGLDEYTTPEVTDAGSTAAIIAVRVTLSGDHNDEKPFLGDTIEVDVNLTMTKAGDAWEVEGYSIENVFLNDDDQVEDDIDDDIEGEI
jgi:hypothetical protein